MGLLLRKLTPNDRHSDLCSSRRIDSLNNQPEAVPKIKGTFQNIVLDEEFVRINPPIQVLRSRLDSVFLTFYYNHEGKTVALFAHSVRIKCFGFF